MGDAKDMEPIEQESGVELTGKSMNPPTASDEAHTPPPAPDMVGDEDTLDPMLKSKPPAPNIMVGLREIISNIFHSLSSLMGSISKFVLNKAGPRIDFDDPFAEPVGNLEDRYLYVDLNKYRQFFRAAKYSGNKKAADLTNRYLHLYIDGEVDHDAKEEDARVLRCRPEFGPGSCAFASLGSDALGSGSVA